MKPLRQVRVLINPRAGQGVSFDHLRTVMDRAWDRPGIDLTYQFSHSIADGKRKTRRAVAQGVDTILAVGGDGMVNSIGGELVGKPVAFGVVPVGSGNGFARHFGIPLNPEKAVTALFESERCAIDVGTANGSPFFVTCSMAWDATVVRTFEKSPVRGILPYVFAAAYEFLGYLPQPFEVTLDDQEILHIVDPLVFTIANLTQYGGGARIAPKANPSDGFMELVMMQRKHTAWLVANVGRLFDGTIYKMPNVVTRRFRKLDVQRKKPAPIQMDGELVEAPAAVSVRVLPKALTVLVPKKKTDAHNAIG